jgi:hypothetical protein
MKIKLNVTPIPQTNPICKPTAIAVIDLYYYPRKSSGIYYEYTIKDAACWNQVRGKVTPVCP